VSCFGGHGVPKLSQQPGKPEKIPLEMECVATAKWPECLKACIEVGGGHFE